jgi:predicted enzyme related to lactoylglutathione lyase
MLRAPYHICGGGLAPRDADFTQPRSYVEVDSIDESLEVAAANGATVLKGKTQIDASSWWAVFADPDGNSIGLYETHSES